ELRAVAGVKPCLTLGAAARQGPASRVEVAGLRGDEPRRLLAPALPQRRPRHRIPAPPPPPPDRPTVWRTFCASRAPRALLAATSAPGARARTRWSGSGPSG